MKRHSCESATTRRRVEPNFDFVKSHRIVDPSLAKIRFEPRQGNYSCRLAFHSRTAIEASDRLAAFR
jgi:hypothetical protein